MKINLDGVLLIVIVCIPTMTLVYFTPHPFKGQPAWQDDETEMFNDDFLEYEDYYSESEECFVDKDSDSGDCIYDDDEEEYSEMTNDSEETIDMEESNDSEEEM